MRYSVFGCTILVSGGFGPSVVSEEKYLTIYNCFRDNTLSHGVGYFVGGMVGNYAIIE